MATTIIRPISDIGRNTYVVGTNGETTNLYSFIDEDTLSISDYLKSNSNGTELLTKFNFTSLPNNAVINSITVNGYVGADKGTSSLNLYFKDVTLPYDSAYGYEVGSMDAPPVATLFSKEFTINPYTTSEWTIEDLSDIGFSFGTRGNAIFHLYQLYIEVDYTVVTPYDFYLWSANTLPWQLSLPWQYQNGWGIIGTVANYVITGVNTIFTRLINLLTSVTSYSITGINAILSRLRNLLTGVTSYTISGVNVNLILNAVKVLLCAVTDYSITTVNSIFSWGRTLFSSVTNYYITGINAFLTRLRNLITSITNYTITGVNVNLLRPIRNLISSVGEYVINSTGIGLYKGWGMLCEVTSYVISGVNVNLTRLINLLTSVTDYSITTINAIIQRLVILFANTTNYLITTVDTTFTKALNLLLEVTDYTITGIDATFSRLRNLITEKAEYLITGVDVNLLRPIRNMAVSVTTYTITTFSVIFRGIGDWLWKWTSKPSSTYTNTTKPSSIWTNKNKIE